MLFCTIRESRENKYTKDRRKITGKESWDEGKNQFNRNFPVEMEKHDEL